MKKSAKKKSTAKTVAKPQEEREAPTSMDSLMQQIKTAPIAKETVVANKNKIVKPSNFDAMFKEMKVSEQYTKKQNTNSINSKIMHSHKKITISRQI
jgi:hypothetical protein